MKLIRRPKDLLEQEYSYLKDINFRDSQVFIELEAAYKKGLQLSVSDKPGESREFTYRGYVLGAGPDVKDLEFGDLVWLDGAVDIRAELNESHTNVPKMIRNPNAAFFTVKPNQGEFWRRNVLPKEKATVLVDSFMIRAFSDGFVDL